MPATRLEGVFAENIPGVTPAPAQGVGRGAAKPRAMRPSEFADAATSGADPYDVDAPPDDSQLGHSDVDHSKARVDEVASKRKKPKDDDLEFGDPDDAELDALNEPETEPEAEDEYDEFGNKLERPDAKAQQEWTQKLAEGLAKGQIPHDLLKDIPVEVSINGRSVQVPFEEMRNGYMRQSDYTRAKNETFALRDRSEHILQLERQRSQEWRDPNMLRQGLRAMVGDNVVFQMARQVATEWAQFKELSPVEQRAHLERQALDQERAQFQMQQQQFMQMNQRQNNDAATQAAAERLEDYMPRALKAQGVGMYPRSRDLFYKNIEILCREDGDISPQRCKEAAAAVREQLADEREQVKVRQSKRPVVPGGARAATRQEQTQRDPNQPDVIRNSRGGGGLPRSSSGQVGMRPSDIRGKMGY